MKTNCVTCSNNEIKDLPTCRECKDKSNYEPTDESLRDSAIELLEKLTSYKLVCPECFYRDDTTMPHREGCAVGEAQAFLEMAKQVIA